MKGRLLRSLLGLVLLAANEWVAADDIDLFTTAPTSSDELPNVLIVLDNTANWGALFSDEKSALASVVRNLPANKFRLGLMMFTESGSPNAGTDGGYVRAAVRAMNADTKSKYEAMINALDVNGDKSNNGKAATAMEEAYRYFAGGTPYAGNLKEMTDYAGNTAGNIYDQAIYGMQGESVSGSSARLNGNALSAFGGSTYNSPRLTNCAKNFIIYISNGAAMENNNDSAGTNQRLAGLGGDTKVIPLSPTLPQDSKMDEWARFMKKQYGIVTYTIEAAKSSQQSAAWSQLLRSAAMVTEGKYFDVSANPSAANISNALESILSEIQSVNSVFASVSLPVSVNTQGTYLNQVFIGMFRPTKGALPRWAGNLKQYKMGFTNGVLQLQDADSSSAISSNGTGFIAECARSFWTPTIQDSYWSEVLTEPNCTLAPAASNTPDGNLVEKGGQGYKTRTLVIPSIRQIKTCNDTNCTGLAAFDTSNSIITVAALGAADSIEQASLINWARGQNNALDVQDSSQNYLNPDERVAGSNTTSMRPSVHGDVVHSRPVAINYGSDTTTARQVVVFYGANDGTLRAVNGNQDGELSIGTGNFGPGEELWSFLPPEFFSKIKRLRDNTVPIKLATSTVDSAQPKPYGFDGPVTAYKSGNAARLFSTMRRGGRAVYAFNVDDPANPQLLWKGGCATDSYNPATKAWDDSGCLTLGSSSYSGVGQTWSSMKVITAAGYSSPLLVMGGGYDPCEDTDSSSPYENNSCDSTTKGNRIFVIDSGTGVIQASFGTERAVVADVAVVPGGDGKAAYLYAVDLGGNVYRIAGDSNGQPQPFGNVAPSSWKMTKIAALGCDNTNACNPNRKLMFAPDVVVVGDTNYLMFGSGDREKPLSAAIYPGTAQVENYFYMIKDKPMSAIWLTNTNKACSGVICSDSLLNIANGSSNPTQADLDKYPLGWRLELADGEQVVTSAITIYGVINFSTNQPTPPEAGKCTTLGTARVYNINYQDASPLYNKLARFSVVAGGGLPPSPVAGLVQLDDSGASYPFCIGCDPASPLQAGTPPTPPIASQPKAKVYWNIEQ